jgi:iron complex transport system substrate-binding protein
MQNASRVRLVFRFLTLFLLITPNQVFAATRIVALNPMISEWSAVILGKDQALKSLIGASEFSHYPEYLKNIPTVGPYPNLQVEKILSMKPDLVIGSVEYNRPDQIEKLRKLKINVRMLPKEEFQSMGKWIRELGMILEANPAANRLSEDWTRRVAALAYNGKPKKVFYQIQFQPLITVGSASFIHDVFGKIGYFNIFGYLGQAYPKISKEAVLERSPDEVLVFEMVANGEDRRKIKETWKTSKVVFLSGDDFARCSPRLLSAVERMIRK